MIAEKEIKITAILREIVLYRRDIFIFLKKTMIL